jgi:hypothetical protein
LLHVGQAASLGDLGYSIGTRHQIVITVEFAAAPGDNLGIAEDDRVRRRSAPPLAPGLRRQKWRLLP